MTFREAMARLASGVVLVTTQMDGRPWGMTVSSCCSVSVSPPTLLVSLASTAPTCAAILRNQSFGVNILGRDSIDAARFGSARGVPKFLDDDRCAAGASLTPMLRSALVHLDCILERTIHVSDHQLLIGRVRQVKLARETDPLIYYDREFRTLAAAIPTDPLYTQW